MNSTYELTLTDADGAEVFATFPSRFEAVEYLHSFASRTGLIVMDSGLYSGTELVGPWTISER